MRALLGCKNWVLRASVDEGLLMNFGRESEMLDKRTDQLLAVLDEVRRAT
jgi:hypothetical protein